MASEVKISALPPISIGPNDIGPFVHSGITGRATAQQVYEANRRDGISASVKADASVTATVTFSPPFPNILLSLNGIVLVNYSGTDEPILIYKITSVSVNGFFITVFGGQPGSTVDIHYGATGE